MKIKTTLVALILATQSAFAFNSKVMIDSLSVRNKPDGNILSTINYQTETETANNFKNWLKTEKGWINGDFTKEQGKPFFIETEKISGIFATVISKTKAVTENDREVELKPFMCFPVIKIGSRFITASSEYGTIAIRKNKVKIDEGTFPAGITTENSVTLNPNDTRETGLLKERAFLIKFPDNTYFSNFNRIKISPVNIYLGDDLKTTKLTNSLNLIADTFNSVRSLSPITERLGYFPKVLPITEKDIKTVKLENGKNGIYLSIKYIFYNLDGKEIRNRKTRLILKKGNEIFWEKLAKEVFNNSKNVKFIQFNILRFDGKSSFEKQGFIAIGTTAYKNGILDAQPDIFMDNTESELSEDLWFFANEVYERVESGS